MASDMVLVTGASGYVAGHVVKLLLQQGGHAVRGTVRSLKNEDKVKHLYNLCPEASPKLELVEADLTKPETWDPAVEGMDYVIHVASPFPMESPRNEDEVVKPAVDGTLNVLRACAKAKCVKRVVLTSSCTAVDWMLGPQSHDKPRDETYWSDPSRQDPYSKSKTLAERAAWDFLKDLPDDEKFELAVINPSMVLGPPLQGSTCTSVDVMKKLLNREMPMVPRVCFPIVDVRDVALMHVRAMTSPEAAGNRHIANNRSLWFSEVASVVKAVFGPQGYNVPTSTAPKLLLRMFSVFDSSVKIVLPNVGVVRQFDNTRMRTVLQVEPREIRETLIDMAHALIEAGFVKRTKKYKGPGGEEEKERYMAVELSTWN